MSRSTRTCASCSGRTRHDDRRCSRCRRSPRRRTRLWYDAGDGRMIEIGGVRSITLTPPERERAVEPLALGLHVSGTIDAGGRIRRHFAGRAG